jgi:hypothetical protein
MALSAVVVLFAFAAYVVHSAHGRAEAESLDRDAADRVAERPVMPTSSEIPDTVPPEWTDVYGSDNGR